MALNLEVTNNATGSLAAGIAAGATSLSVKAGEGADFPTTAGSEYFYVTLQKDSGAWEVVKVTERSTDTFTVTRNVDSSTGSAQTFSADDIVSLRPCASVINDIVDYINALDSLYFNETELKADNNLGIDMGNISANRSDLSHSELTDDEATKHRLINDSGTATTELWSASKINGLIPTASTPSYIGDIALGFVMAPTFAKSSDTDLSITGFRYHHVGTAEQIVKNSTDLTFVTGSGGSNAGSTDLGTSEWHALYLDDSAIVSAATNVISETELLNSTTMPTWDSAKMGWYNGNDRAIFLFYVDSGGDIQFFVHSRDHVRWNEAVSIATSVSTSFVAQTFRAVAPIKTVIAHYYGYGDSGNLYYQHPDDADGGSILLMSLRRDSGGDNQDYGTEYGINDIDIDSSQQANFKGSCTVDINQVGYVLPQGM